MHILSIIFLVILGIIYFLGFVLLKFSPIFIFIFVFAGVCALWALRFSYKQPSLMGSFGLGFKAALAPFLVSFVLYIIFFHRILACPSILMFGIVIVPLISGLITFVSNIIPPLEDESHKIDFEKHYNIKF